VLSYAALDLGAPKAALDHTTAAWHCADAVGDDELRAWVRGTQSLILRFENRYQEALDAARDGQQYAKRGSGIIRLLCGEAQCHANLGNSREANATLDQALNARDHLHGTDTIGGLFEFTEAKQHYYAGSSLIWLDGGADAARAAREAEEAIALWEHEPAERRSLDDEALAHIYLSTARLQLHDLDGAMEAVRPILELPTDRRISWIDRRIDRVAELLTKPPYDRSPVARDAYCELRTYDNGS
jgi:tetratricopeptide (TPR) repeat protein